MASSDRKSSGLSKQCKCISLCLNKKKTRRGFPSNPPFPPPTPGPFTGVWGVGKSLLVRPRVNMYIKHTNSQQIIMSDPNPLVFQLLSSLFFLCLGLMCRPQDHSWRILGDSEWKVFVPFLCCSHEQKHHVQCNPGSCPFHPPPLAARYLRDLQSRLQSHCSRCHVQVCPRLKE